MKVIGFRIPGHQGVYPCPHSEGQTHWADCWRTIGHHNCAVVRIEWLEAQLETFVRGMDPENKNRSAPTEIKELKE